LARTGEGEERIIEVPAEPIFDPNVEPQREDIPTPIRPMPEKEKERETVGV
jgi:hypothetical protein